MNQRRRLFTISFILIAGCKDSLMLEGQGTIEGAEDTSAVESLPTDRAGIVSAPVTMNTKDHQIVRASHRSNIIGASIVLPPDSLPKDTTISIEEGLPIVGRRTGAELGLEHIKFEAVGPAVVVGAAHDFDTLEKFKLTLPTYTATGFGLTGKNTVVIYKIRKSEENKFFTGLAPKSELEVLDGEVIVYSQHFGSYQIATTDQPVTQKAETKTRRPVLTSWQQEAGGDGGPGGSGAPGGATNPADDPNYQPDIYPFKVTGPDGTLATPSAMITWEYAEGAVSYDVMGAQDEECTTPIQFMPNVTDTSIILTNFDHGSYFACVTAKDAFGGKLAAENNGLPFHIDLEGPSFSFSGIPNNGFTNNPSITITLVGDEIAGSRFKVGPSDTTSCGDEAGYTDGSGPDSIDIDLSNSPDGDYRLCVLATDDIGNETEPGGAGQLDFTLDRVPPPALDRFDFSSAYGFGTVGADYQIPNGASDYHRLVIMGDGTATAPSCDSNRVLATFEQPFQLSGRVSSNPGAGETYSFRACSYDAAGNLTEEAINNVVGTNNIRIFVSSETFSAAFGEDYQGQSFSDPFAGADYRCQYLADNENLGGRWRAILGYYENNDDQRRMNQILAVPNQVINMNPNGAEIFADSPSNYWGYSHGKLVSPGYTERGDLVENDNVWTGANADGYSSSDDCNVWTDTSTSYWGSYGQAQSWSNSNGWMNWGTQNCASSARIYCLEQPPVPDTPELQASAAANGNSVDITLNLVGGDIDELGEIRIFRGFFGTAINTQCDRFPSSSVATNIKTYDGTGVPFVSETINDPAGFGNFSYTVCSYTKYLTVDQIVTIEGIATYTGPTHTAFVTSSTYNGNFGGIAGADAACVTSAASAGLVPVSGSWKAIMSGPTDAATRISITMPVVNTQGAFIADNAADFWDGTIKADGIRYSETGSTYYGYSTWTGSNWNGTTALDTCVDWTHSGTLDGEYGYSGYVSTNWLQGSDFDCSSFRRIYCIDGQ